MGRGDAGRGRTAEEPLARLTLAGMSFRVCCLLGTGCDAADEQRIVETSARGGHLNGCVHPNPACPHLLFTLLCLPPCHIQALLDTLDCGKRYIHIPGSTWPDAEEGGVTKPSTVVL